MKAERMLSLTLPVRVLAPLGMSEDELVNGLCAQADGRCAVSDYPRILEVLSTAWDTTGGQSLRALMWSLHNDRVAVPMWTVMTDLDSGLRADFGRLIVLELDPRGKAVERLLIDSDEWNRVDDHPLRWEVVEA